MHKFNNNNITTGYIKMLLSTFNLPQIKTIVPGVDLVPNSNYIHKGALYKFNGLTTERLSKKDDEYLQEFENLKDSSKLLKVTDYHYGQHLLNITNKLNIRGPYYDSYTHEYLGDYLRFQRDYLKVDLMSMYNCFSDRMPTNIEIEFDDIAFSSKDSEYRLYVVPVKFNRKYTIGIDCDTSVEMFSGFYADKEIKVGLEETATQFYKNTYKREVGTKLKKPFVYDKLCDSIISNEQHFQEKNLVLFFKVPFASNSSIVILEGDYTKNTDMYYEEGQEKLNINNKITSKDSPLYDENEIEYISKIQLLNMNSETSYPYADRLLEYLFESAIDSRDSISKNIERVQKVLTKQEGDLKLPAINNYGNWTEQLRRTLYKNAVALGLVNSTFDSIGYYDKDLEERLGE